MNDTRTTKSEAGPATIQLAVRTLGKQYSRPGNGLAGTEQFWALRDVGFSVECGEVVGIIGDNGAGKSTLLKILSRITEPTEGRIEIRGRVGSLLEVGTGFHPELSGRENVFLNGAVLGMGKSEVRRKFDEIVAFAEVERFIDTPVKHYSSGMYMRLAFAVAAHLEPEILIVDEVLAVGDAAFQKRCLGKMGEVSRHGRTVLFVSHNMTAVRTLCTRVVYLSSGRVLYDGEPKEGVARYLQSSTASGTVRRWNNDDATAGCASVRLTAAECGSDRDIINVSDEVALSVEYEVTAPEGLRLNLSIILANEEGIRVLVSPSLSDTDWGGKLFSPGRYRSTCTIPGRLLNDGTYHIDVYFVRECTEVLFRVERAVSFEVHDDGQDRGNWHGEWQGVVRPRLKWRTVRKSADSGLPGLTADGTGGG